VPDTITITDDRTGKTVTVPIVDGIIPSSAFRDLDKDLFVYDPAFLSSSRRADDGMIPSMIGTVTVFPVRSSVIVMVSGTCFPLIHVVKGASSPRRRVPRTAQQSSGERPRPDGQHGSFPCLRGWSTSRLSWSSSSAAPTAARVSAGSMTASM